jgi:amino-acid N-acetyltransferase
VSTGPLRPPEPFSEKGFYLQEFRGRTIAIAVPAAELRDAEALRAVVEEIGAYDISAVLISTERSHLAPLVGDRVVSAAAPRLEALVWRRLCEHAVLGVVVGGSLAFAPSCRELVLRLGIGKLVWLDRDGGILGAAGKRLSFVHRAELREILEQAAPANQRRLALLREIAAMLDAGVPAVNVCTLEGLADELFTYAGSGTLFTPERYVVVRRLGIDDFDAAADLIARGVEEGYLVPRTPEQIDAVLASGFGAFVEGRHLAGIGALLPDPASGGAEIASLYTLTRFLGEGVGGHLVTWALERARERGLSFCFACTTSERVGAFFERNGFRVAGPDEIPAAKWRGYSSDRRAQLRCYRRDLEPRESGASEPG